jgi:flagellar basal-body rod protein FlgF
MLYGLYLSAQGVQVQTLRQGVVANNLANTASTSFKRDFLRIQSHASFDEEHGASTWLGGNLESMPGGVSPAETVTDFSQGSLTKTGAPLDVALSGPGFLRVQNGKEELLTRDGKLAINQNNQLVTRDHGYTLLTDTGGTLPNVDPTLPVTILADGSVSQGGNVLGRLAIVAPPSNSDLRKTGQNMYATESRLAPVKEAVEVRQGYLENAGVNPIHGMMELIESSRALEANVNMIRHQDEALSRLLQTLPRK